jgi:hypothetical protein
VSFVKALLGEACRMKMQLHTNHFVGLTVGLNF